MFNNELTMKEGMKPVDFLKKADITHIACVDERPRIPGFEADFHSEKAIPVQIPGGIYGIVDTLKSVLDVSEAKSWEIVKNAKLPIRIHFGPIHSHDANEEEGVGPLGCGYANLVENHPEKIGAKESVKAQDRMITVFNLGGKVYSVEGPHVIKHATLVWKEGSTIDSETAFVKHGIGILNCDPWAAGFYADTIIAANPGIKLDKDKFVQNVVNQFKLVVDVLAPTLQVEEIK